MIIFINSLSWISTYPIIVINISDFIIKNTYLSKHDQYNNKKSPFLNTQIYYTVVPRIATLICSRKNVAIRKRRYTGQKTHRNTLKPLQCVPMGDKLTAKQESSIGPPFSLPQ